MYYIKQHIYDFEIYSIFLQISVMFTFTNETLYMNNSCTLSLFVEH